MLKFISAALLGVISCAGTFINANPTAVSNKANANATLTINYLKKSDGTQIAAPFVQSYERGSQYNIVSSAITGFIPTTPFVKGYIWESDQTFNVYYDEYVAYTGATVTSLTGAGTEASPYLINTPEDLIYLASWSNTGMDANKNFLAGQFVKLGASLDMAGSPSWSAICPNLKKGVSSFTTWFAGTFDGDNHIIANLNGNIDQDFVYGLFGGLKNANVKNLNMSGSLAALNRIGSICYVVDQTVNLNNVNSYVDVTLSSTTGTNGDGISGGLVGLINGNATLNINSCVYGGALTINHKCNYVGGLVGHGTNAGSKVFVYDSANRGNIVANNLATGNKCIAGIVGGGWYEAKTSLNTIIDNCENHGDITLNGAGDGGYFGGIWGGTYAFKGKVNNCRNYGALNFGVDTAGSGGIVGIPSSLAHTVTNNTNYGTITSKTRVGGIAGKVTGAVVFQNNDNYGKITGTGEFVGGIVGNTTAACTVESCENHATVTGGSSAASVGGIVGGCGKATINNCLNDASVTGKASVGGAAGTLNDSSSLKNTVIKGTVTGTSNAGGLVGWNGIGSKIDLATCNWDEVVVSCTGGTPITGFTNNVLIEKYYAGEVIDYDIVVPGDEYVPTETRITAPTGKRAKWYSDSLLTTEYVATSYGTAGTNYSNKHESVYLKFIKTPATLLAEIKAMDTCEDYENVMDVRLEISELTESEQTTLLAEYIQEESCTVETKLEYMEYLLGLDTTANVSNGLDGTNVIGAVACLGAVTLVAFALLSKKARKHHN